mgnify:CR=1 FL=1
MQGENFFVGVPQGPAAMVPGPSFVGGQSGRWATERFLQAIKTKGTISPSDLRTNEILTNDEWKIFDNEVLAEAQVRLRAVSLLLSAGLRKPIANSLAKTVFQWRKTGDMDPAMMSMSGLARTENDRTDYEDAQLPIPITHKDFFFDLRTLLASRLAGEPLDTTYARVAGRKIAEEIERCTLLGGKQFGNLSLYGLLTYPFRNVSAFGTNGAWSQAAKTGDDIIADVNTGIAALQADRFDGPYWVWHSSNFGLKLNGDYKAASDKTIRQRILELDGVARIDSIPTMPASTVLIFQPTPDVIQILDGESPQTVQWDVHGGFQLNFKAFQIMVPLIRSDISDRSGIFHMS